MRSRVYLIFNARGFVRAAKGGAKWNEKVPYLESGERAVRLEVTVPDSAFSPMGAIQASIVVPEAALMAPKVVVDVTAPLPSDGE
jgi:hypothetical protein